MNGPFSGSTGSPKIFANWVQFEIRIGVLTGPPGARPTNAATDVLTPSIGFDVDGTSSTYTPGVRYVGMSFLRSGDLKGAQLGQQFLGDAGHHPARPRCAGIDDLHDVLRPRPQHDLRVRRGLPDPVAELARGGLIEVEHHGVRSQARGVEHEPRGLRPVADDLDPVLDQQATHADAGDRLEIAEHDARPLASRGTRG